MDNDKKECLVCKRDDQTIPLIQITYRDTVLWICPEHMPILIHNTDKLMAMLENPSS